MLINQSKFLTSRFRIVNPLIVRFKSYRVVVAGGGSGGISVASKLKHLAKGDLAIIEPNQVC